MTLLGPPRWEAPHVRVSAFDHHGFAAHGVGGDFSGTLSQREVGTGMQAVECVDRGTVDPWTGARCGRVGVLQAAPVLRS